MFFSYLQLKIGQNTPAHEQTSLQERKDVNLNSGVHRIA